MSMEFSLIPFGGLTRVIAALGKLLPKSQEWSHGRAIVDDIVGFLYSGRMQLWLAYTVDPESHGFSVHAYVITEIKEYPRCKALVCQYCAGESNHMQLVDDRAHALLERYARDTGCSVIEFHGRPGWRSAARKHGFTTETVVYEKFLGEEQ